MTSSQSRGMMLSASVVASISPLAFRAPSFRAPPTFLLVWMKTISAYSAAISRVLSFELPSTTMISYSSLPMVWSERDLRQAAMFFSSL